jgi:aryl-alcohol dehydrogenase-like predicted oxidoreductase
MEYVKLGKSGLKVSKLSLGCWTFGKADTKIGKPGKVNADDAIRMIHQAADFGVNLFDTANRYTDGESEEILGNAIKGRRQDFVIATKVRVWKRAFAVSVPTISIYTRHIRSIGALPWTKRCELLMI